LAPLPLPALERGRAAAEEPGGPGLAQAGVGGPPPPLAEVGRVRLHPGSVPPGPTYPQAALVRAGDLMNAPTYAPFFAGCPGPRPLRRRRRAPRPPPPRRFRRRRHRSRRGTHHPARRRDLPRLPPRRYLRRPPRPPSRRLAPPRFH